MTNEFDPNNSLILTDMEEISVDSRSENYCICIVDMVDSTRITARISDLKKIIRYYSIFLNTMAAIARGHKAKIIKNVGDSLVYYFPETSDVSAWPGFKNVFECARTMIGAHRVINVKLEEANLPPVDYRISADYGKVEIATSASSMSEDIFGPTVSMCSKINFKASKNSLVIGGDLYRVLTNSFPLILKDHCFRETGGYSGGLKHSYPVYQVTSKLKPLDIQLDASKAKSGGGLSSTCPNIMIVEDEKDLAFTYKSILSEEGWNVRCFTDSEDALKHYAEIYPCLYDLVILDIRMPKLNGLQLYYRLRSITSGVKIMFISALDAADELVSILPSITYDDIVKKPIRREELIETISGKLRLPAK
jgi:two-component system, OmpR family, response regulator ChvI